MKNTALITGATSGIGKELARIHASKGGNLIVVARREDELEKLKSELESQHNIEVYNCCRFDEARRRKRSLSRNSIKRTESRYINEQRWTRRLWKFT
jgi:short-subunit dehydrogenase